MVKLIRFLFVCAVILAIAGCGLVGITIWYFGRDLPDYQQLAHYQPPIMTRVQAGDGRLLAEYATERRIFVPIQAIPKRVIDAFVSAEDKNFYTHHGIDPVSMMRAAITDVGRLRPARRPIGASTITQQVAKNMLLSNEVSLARKIKEVLLATRIEAAMPKDRILELYLNEIYLGSGAYGVAAAALTYFDKSLDDLTLGEAAFLGGLPKAPNRYNPAHFLDAATARRDWVLDRMVEDGYAHPPAADAAEAEPIVLRRREEAEEVKAPYFAEEVRRELLARYGEKALYGAGLSVRTSLDPRLQADADKALARRADRLRSRPRRLARGDRPYRPQGRLGGASGRGPGSGGGERCRLASGGGAAHHARGGGDRLCRRRHRACPVRADALGAAALPWRQPRPVPARRRRCRQARRRRHGGAGRGRAGRERQRKRNRKGRRRPERRRRRRQGYQKDGCGGRSRDASAFTLCQVPEVSGALVVMDPHTGRVLALSGGFSFAISQFDRATQAYRQTGSAIKPFVFLTALDHGFTPSTLVSDAPISLPQGPGLPMWTPTNYEADRFRGPTPLRIGLEQSIDTLTVRLATMIGMDSIAKTIERFGILDHVPHEYAITLGAGETTPLRLTAAYAMIVNGGKRITPTLIDRVQDRNGKTIFRADDRPCDGCSDVDWQHQPVPVIPDTREQVADPGSAYQLVTMMEGVVERGTGDAVKAVGKPIAGKTGTTNDYRDAWFVGFSPDLAAGVYVGYDEPDSLGKDETGGHVAAPIFRDFMIDALKDTPAIDFRIPPGLRLYRVSAATGLPVSRQRAGDLRGLQAGHRTGQGPQSRPSEANSNSGEAEAIAGRLPPAIAGVERLLANADTGASTAAAMPDRPRAAARGASPAAAPDRRRAALRPRAARCCRRAALPPAAPAAYIRRIS